MQPSPHTAGPAAPAPADGRQVTLSPKAVNRIAFLKRKEGNPGLLLRVEVSGGGCSGFQYSFSFSQQVNGDDHVFGDGDGRLVVDDVSLDLLSGAEIDFQEDLAGAFFKVNNPNAVSSCGCGSSFAIS